MNAIVSWFKRQFVIGNEVENGKTGVDVESNSPRVFYDIMDEHNCIIMSDLPEKQAINYCLIYRMQGQEAYLVKREEQL